MLAFVHQPLLGDQADGWEMPASARQAFDAAVEGADVRVVASGHRHCAARFGRAAWAPSLTIEGTAREGTDPRCGVVEHRLGPGGRHAASGVRPWT